MTQVAEMTVSRYLETQRESADPKVLLDLAVAETERLKEEHRQWVDEYKIATEVTLDEHLNYKPKTLAQLQRLARMYAESGYVPDHFKENIANTAIGVQMALRCGVDIMTFLQSSYIVHGKPGIEGKLVIAMLNSSDQVKGRVRFEFSGEGKARACTAFAIDASTGNECSQTVTWEMVEKEGWDKNTKWKSLTDLMFCYRSAVFLARVHFPDVLMGMRTVDELEDITAAPTVGVSSFEELHQHITQSLEKSPEQQAADGGSKPRGRRKAAAAPEPQKTPEPIKEEEAAVTVPEKTTEVAEEPDNSSDAELQKKITRAVNYCKSMFGPRCDEFDLQLIGLAAAEMKTWTLFCKAIIDKTVDNWETYLLPEDGGEITEAEESQETEEINDRLPPSIENPVGRPPMIGGAARALEVNIQSKKQAKRIRDLMREEITGHPDLLPEEIAYLLCLGDRRAWYIEHGKEPPKERQIPE